MVRALPILFLAPALWAAQIELHGNQPVFFTFTAAPGEIAVFETSDWGLPTASYYDEHLTQSSFLVLYPGPFFTPGFSEITRYDAMIERAGTYTLSLAASCPGCSNRLWSALSLTSVPALPEPVHMPEPASWLTLAASVAIGLVWRLRQQFHSGRY